MIALVVALEVSAVAGAVSVIVVGATVEGLSAVEVVALISAVGGASVVQVVLAVDVEAISVVDEASTVFWGSVSNVVGLVALVGTFSEVVALAGGVSAVVVVMVVEGMSD